MIPGYFREFDRVAQESFGFLVSEKPTVEFWRDYYLAYELPNDKKMGVGIERGMGVPRPRRSADARGADSPDQIGAAPR